MGLAIHKRVGCAEDGVRHEDSRYYGLIGSLSQFAMDGFYCVPTQCGEERLCAAFAFVHYLQDTVHVPSTYLSRMAIW